MKPPYLIEQPVRSDWAADQIHWANEAIATLEEKTRAWSEASAAGLLIRADSEEGLETAVTRLKNSYARLTFGETRVFCPGQSSTVEAWVTLKVEVPERVIGEALGSLSARRGHIVGLDQSAETCHVEAEAPVSGLLGYVREISTLAGESIVLIMKFRSYEAKPDPDPPRGAAAAKVA